jgi:hypothetical protein
MENTKREKKEILLMIKMYCRKYHHSKNLCESCAELKNFAFKRIDKCRFIENKPNCADCTVHCFGKEKRERVREVMRYAGPRMMFRHPVIALRHTLRKKSIGST